MLAINGRQIEHQTPDALSPWEKPEEDQKVTRDSWTGSGC